MTEQTKQEFIRTMARNLVNAMKHGDEVTKAKIIQMVHAALEKLGIDGVEREMVKIHIECLSFSAEERVRMHNVLARMMELTFLFQSDPPSVEVYQEGKPMDPMTGELAQDLFEAGYKLAAEAECSHHDAMRSLLMGSMLRKNMEDVKRIAREKGHADPFASTGS